VHADATSGTVNEGVIGTARQTLGQIVVPTLGAELVRIFAEPALIAMGHPWHHGDSRSLRYVTVADFAIRHRLTANAWHRWTEAHGFLDDPLRESQAGNIRSRRWPTRQNRIQLGGQAGVGLRVQGKKIETKGQCDGRGLVSGEKQRHHFIPQLLVGLVNCTITIC
jgi:hypothetical protein